MPKETIAGISADTALVLRWGRDDTTGQLGVDYGETYFSFHADQHLNEVPEYNSLWFTFESRDEYNRAIRALRKMRDAQFGRDE